MFGWKCDGPLKFGCNLEQPPVQAGSTLRATSIYIYIYTHAFFAIETALAQ